MTCLYFRFSLAVRIGFTVEGHKASETERGPQGLLGRSMTDNIGSPSHIGLEKSTADVTSPNIVASGIQRT